MDELETLDPFEKMLLDERKAQDALAARYKSLQSSLERRVNMPFDPRLMRVAQAFLSPTKTGSFGESLGLAANALVDESEKDALRQRETLKMQAELEERMLEMKRQGLGLQALQRLRPGEKPTGPTKPTTPAGIPSDAIGIQIAPPNPSYMPDEEYAVMLYSSGKKPGEIAEAIEKRRRDNLEFRETAILDKSTNTLYLTPKGDVVKDFPVRNPETGKFEPYNVPDTVAARLSQLQLTDPSAYDQIVREQVFGQRPAAGALAVPTDEPADALAMGAPAAGVPSTLAAAGRRPTATESAVSAAATEAEAKKIAEGGADAFNKSQTAYEGAPNLFIAAQNMDRLVQNNPRAFELLSKPGIANAIMRAADEGIQIGLVGSVKLPTAELAKYDLPQEDLDTLNVFANQMAIAKNANRQMTRVVGEGAMSDFETKLANQMLDVPNASPEVIRMINQYTMMRARHLEQKHELLSQLVDQGMSTRRALTSPQMRDLKQRYEDELSAVAQQNASLLSSAADRRKQKKTAAPSGAITPEAIEAERKRRGLP